MNEFKEERYIGLKEAAEFLDIKPVTLRSWIKRKSTMPVHKVGRLWKFKKTELDEWVKSGKSSE
ncbi:helix-turn-helix domain-containing protein [Anaerococcus sp. AGMB00486]|uniref:Helix-turn-helix domain-containing protein n=1 Tax=Anaerococcus faecalis TaxID=2742993 RepID=A0ABX2NAB7_9FIRM|nr:MULTISPECIES: helix-turn-helix domain-containing protein [Anaerococcus]MDD7305396.1 helix-turn-helix domain-containing protein [Peptoniphilaceae bacterium]MDY3007237.1 helix-turn-helix domain-containing protein [Anaerococcus porci]NVF11657.1 helix-turn-helix domain-containing protein [Anaerococcus faecalis]